jgi:cytoskeletal protein CcmA (bactofilin family)
MKEVTEHLNTIIGAGTTVAGELNIVGSVRIDGAFCGKLAASGHITLGENGTIESKQRIDCQSAHISGKVTGDMLAPLKVFLAKNASLIGNVTTAALIIEEGAYFCGKCDMTKTPEK